MGNLLRRVAALFTGLLTALLGGGPVLAANTTPRLGIIGNYSDTELEQLRSIAGAGELLVELEWRRAEPTRGVWDLDYLAEVADRIDVLRRAGWRIALNAGVHEAPGWLLALPGARYVDQHGQAYTDSDEPNLLFGTHLRYMAVRYLTKVFDQLGTDFTIVRVGGGHWGELTYPSRLDPATGRIRNLYYAYDDNADGNPVPTWTPGDPSPNGEAHQFLSWYLNSLAYYQNWQIHALRKAGFGGTAAVLYPSYGMRPGDFEAAVATDLAGTSSAEINGEVQRGYDAKRQVNALNDPYVAVYGTWADNPQTLAWLAQLAGAHDLPVMAETSHGCPPEDLPAVFAAARQHGLAAIYPVRQPVDAVTTAAPGLDG